MNELPAGYQIVPVRPLQSTAYSSAPATNHRAMRTVSDEFGEVQQTLGEFPTYAQALTCIQLNKDNT